MMYSVCRWRMISVAALVFCIGCGGSNAPEVGTVSGTVTHDGKPLAEAGVLFTPEGARHSVAWTDAAGRYELNYLREMQGAVVGEHVVKITTFDDEAEIPESLPACYNRESTLRRTVKSGSNTFDFELLSIP